MRNVLVQPRKTPLCLTERLLNGHKESNQTNKQTNTDMQQQDIIFITDILRQDVSSF